MMGRKTIVWISALALAGTAACSKKPFPADLCMHASPQLQWYEGKAHTLYVRAFPLNATDGFVSTDVSDLLADPAPSILGAAGPPQSRMLYPESTDRLTFSPAKGQEFSHVGVVAGYYERKGRVKQVIEVPELKKNKKECYTVEFGASGIQGAAEGEAGGKKQ
jgi:predicted component of type VI protein secretion system